MAETYQGWCIVELFGHKRLAGYLRSQEIPGGTLPCLDVPATDPVPGERSWSGAPKPTIGYSKMLGVAAIYGITPVDESVARRAAREIERNNDPLPVSLPALPAGPSSNAAGMDVEDDGGNWVRDDQAVHDMVLLAGRHLSLTVLESLDDDTIYDVEEWAAAVHVNASDNDDVVVPSRPSVISELPEGQWEPVCGCKEVDR